MRHADHRRARRPPCPLARDPRRYQRPAVPPCAGRHGGRDGVLWEKRPHHRRAEPRSRRHPARGGKRRRRGRGIFAGAGQEDGRRPGGRAQDAGGLHGRPASPAADTARARRRRRRRGGRAHALADLHQTDRVLPAGHRRTMIARVSGVLAERAGDTIVVETDGGVGYALAVPTGVAERLPAAGGRVSLFTELVVKEDGWSLYGFDRPAERLVFQRLLGASGFGPKLALSLLSALGAERTMRSILSRDLAALSSVSGVGRKKAERLVLELQDRFGDVSLQVPAPRGPGSDEAGQDRKSVV